MKIVKMPVQTWAYVQARSGLGTKEINNTIAKSFDQLTRKIDSSGVRTEGPPRAHDRYRDGDPIGFDIGFTINPDDELLAREAGLLTGETLAGEALMHIHRGPYASLAEAYRRMEQDLNARGIKGRGDLWEIYLNDPDACPAPELLTQILCPVEQAVAA
jgi:hypothetical protein